MRFTILTSLVLMAMLSVESNSKQVLAQKDEALTGISACNKAIGLLGENKPAEALQVLEAAEGTMDKEDEWLWWGNKGHCHRDLRQDKKAITSYEHALKLKPECWFRFSFCRLLHEYGRWDEALEELEKPIDADYADRALALRSVIEGPYREQWPTAYRKLEHRSKKGNYLIVSDVGVTAKEMDRLEKQASALDPEGKRYQKKLDKLMKPSNDLISLANLAELARDQYLKFMGISSKDMPKDKISKVFFMSNEDDFHSFAAKNGNDDTEQTLGFYSPSKKYIQMYSQSGAKSKVFGLSLDTIDTFFHEGWHQTIDLLTEQLPIWMDEGLAEFVGHASVKSKGKNIELGLLIRSRGDHYTRYERIKETINEGNYVPFAEFFYYKTKDWNAGDTNIYYAQAWSIAYFAIKGKDSAFQKAYAKLFRELVKGRPAKEVVDEVFPEKDLKKFEKAWLKFWKKT